MTSAELRRNSGGLIELFTKVVTAARNLVGLGDYFSIGSELLALAQQFLAIEEPWTTGAGVKQRLVLFVAIGKVYTSRTPGTEDDELVAKAETLVQNDAMAEFLASLIARFKAENPAATPEGLLAYVQTDAVSTQMAEFAAEKQIDLATIMELIQLIVKLVAMFKGNGGTTGSGTNTGGVLDF